MKNLSIIDEYVLLGLSTDPDIQIMLFVLFLGIYLLTLMGNLMMILVIRADPHLHTPMHFFLGHLSFLDICLEKAMAPHSSTLAWKIPWMEEPGRLQSMWLLRVRHD